MYSKIKGCVSVKIFFLGLFVKVMISTVISFLILFIFTVYGDTYYPQDVSDMKEADAPEFKPTETNYTVGPGDKAKLKCQVDNLGTKTVSIQSLLETVKMKTI